MFMGPSKHHKGQLQERNRVTEKDCVGCSPGLTTDYLLNTTIALVMNLLQSRTGRKRHVPFVHYCQVQNNLFSFLNWRISSLNCFITSFFRSWKNAQHCQVSQKMGPLSPPLSLPQNGSDLIVLLSDSKQVLSSSGSAPSPAQVQPQRQHLQPKRHIKWEANAKVHSLYHDADSLPPTKHPEDMKLSPSAHPHGCR